MATVQLQNSLLETRLPVDWTIADLQRHLGGIPLSRIRMCPPPGMATLEDALFIDQHEDLACELIDGVLVEKTVGWYESLLAGYIVQALNNFLESHNLGKALTTDATLQILPDQVRMPDACFIGWKRFPQGKLPAEPMPPLVPDLAVEILSAGNTPAEMERKRRDYFAAGVTLVWEIDPKSRTADVYTSPTDVERVSRDGTLSGADVLPGFELSLADLFDRADQFGGRS